MKVGDLVKVLPHGSELHLIIGQLAMEPHPYQDDIDIGLGALWELYEEEYGITQMHAKWIDVINEL